MNEAELIASRLDWAEYEGRTLPGMSVLIDVDSAPRCSFASCRIHVKKGVTLDLRNATFEGCLIEGLGDVTYPLGPLTGDEESCDWCGVFDDEGSKITTEDGFTLCVECRAEYESGLNAPDEHF